MTVPPPPPPPALLPPPAMPPAAPAGTKTGRTAVIAGVAVAVLVAAGAGGWLLSASGSSETVGGSALSAAADAAPEFSEPPVVGARIEFADLYGDTAMAESTNTAHVGIIAHDSGQLLVRTAGYNPGTDEVEMVVAAVGPDGAARWVVANDVLNPTGIGTPDEFDCALTQSGSLLCAVQDFTSTGGAGVTLTVIDPATGEADAQRVAGSLEAGLIIAGDEVVVVENATGYGPKEALVALVDPATGDAKWSITVDSLVTGGSVLGSTLVLDIYDAGAISPLSIDLGSGRTVEDADATGIVQVPGTVPTIERRADDGTVLWASDPTKYLELVRHRDGEPVFALDQQRRLVTLDPQTGAQLWRTEDRVDAAPFSVTAGRVVVGVDRTTYVFDAGTGAEVGVLPELGIATAGDLLYTRTTETLSGYRLESLERAWSVPLEDLDPEVLADASEVTVLNGTVFLVDNQAIRILTAA